MVIMITIRTFAIVRMLTYCKELVGGPLTEVALISQRGSEYCTAVTRLHDFIYMMMLMMMMAMDRPVFNFAIFASPVSPTTGRRNHQIIVIIIIIEHSGGEQSPGQKNISLAIHTSLKTSIP